jgi:hypothetical protein
MLEFSKPLRGSFRKKSYIIYFISVFINAPSYKNNKKTPASVSTHYPSAKSNGCLKLFLFIFIALLTACDIDRIIGVIHTEDRGGVFHGPILSPPEITCAACHGEGLRGTPVAPSCYDCHGDVWSDLSAISPPGPVELPASPIVDQPVAPMPEPDLIMPIEPTPPSDLDGIHVISTNGIFHGRNFLTPQTQCVVCHGGDLNGVPPAPSCRSCHEALWLFKGEPHTKIKEGVAHGKKLEKPKKNCIGCYGDDLLATPDAPSCLNCHGAIWLKDFNDDTNESLGEVAPDEGDQAIHGPPSLDDDIASLLSEVPHDKLEEEWGMRRI